MNDNVFRSYFLVASITISFVLTLFIFRPFITVLVLAAVFAVILQPLYKAILRGMTNSPGLASLVTMIVSIACILIPFTFISIQITNDAQNLYTSISGGSWRTSIDLVLQNASDTISQYIPGFTLSSSDISSSIDQYAQDGLKWLIQNVGGAFGSIVRLLLDLFIFLIALYYLLRDGPTLKRVIIKISPLADTDDNSVFTRLELAIHSVIRGSLMIALIQGILTGIGFTLFGVPNSILWGMTAAFSALIPGIGTSLVLAPGIAYLFLTGATMSGLGLLLWSVFAVGLIDNFLGPRLMGKGTQVHPLAVLLSVFGGLVFFGPAGIFLGPLCISLFFALLSIYQNTLK